MGKPRLLIVIRHAQSEGNKNREIHQSIPDHRVKLTPDGWSQAYEAGRRLRRLLRADDTLHFFTSPYRRTRETTEGILATLTSDDEEPSPFKRSNIKVHEEPRLREQDFGNFQPCSAEMERMWQERADYGHFFYRIPNGESAADAYDRVSGFNESLWRQFGEDDFASVCVLVTHGLMSRVFLMKWYHFTVEYFEDLRNINHCEFLLMRKQEDSGKYLLENKLRTWSELRRERSLLEKEKKDAPPAGLDKSKSFVVTRRWGGCPNGCDHRSHYKRRDDLEVLRQNDEHAAAVAVGLEPPNGTADDVDDNDAVNGSNLLARSASHSNSPSISSLASRRPANSRFHNHHHHHQHGYSSDEDVHHGDAANHNRDSILGTRSAPQIDVTRAREEIVSSPDGTPSFISAEDRLRGLRSPHLHVGRDGGGTYSGHASLTNSDAEDHCDDHYVHRRGSRRRQQQGNVQDRVLSLAAQLEKLPNRNDDDHEDGQPTNGGDPSLARDDCDALNKGHFNGHPPVAVTEKGEVKTTEDIDPDGAGRENNSRANRLGDVHSSDIGSDKEDADEDLARAEREDKSIKGSVY